MPKADVSQLGLVRHASLRYSYALREVIMNFIQDKRFWYSIVAVIVVVIVVAAVFWPRNQITISGASDDKLAGGYAGSSVNNGTKAVTRATRLSTRRRDHHASDSSSSSPASGRCGAWVHSRAVDHRILQTESVHPTPHTEACR